MKRIFTFLIIVALSLYLGAHFFYSKKSKTEELVSVFVVPAVQKTVDVNFQTIGTVQAYSSVDIKSMVTGPIIQIGFKEGKMVKEGQVLFIIDPRPFVAALNQANAALARDQVTLSNNESIQKRNAPLAAKGYLDKQAYDTLVANTKAMSATVQADQAAVKNATINLDYTIIRAPITGKTGNIALKLGSVIKANDTMTLVSINQINPIYVSFSIPQDKFPIIRKNKLRDHSIAVRAMISADEVEQGLLTFIDNSIDIATGTIQLKATFPNTKRNLWPGQYVTVEIPMEHIPNAILIPSLAVVTAQNGFYVYVIDKDSVAHFRPVSIGATIGDSIIVNSGIQAGERVVTVGALRLNEGMKVKIAPGKSVVNKKT